MVLFPSLIEHEKEILIVNDVDVRDDDMVGYHEVTKIFDRRVYTFEG